MKIGKHLAFRWRRQALEPVAFPQRIKPADLLGIERQKEALLANTRRFVLGQPANHALLTGARGTGKSSLVKALLTAFGAQGLRLVEVPPHDLTDLPDIVAPLRGRPERFILYVDDFSVGAQDPALTALKTALDGGVEEAPENVLINDEYHWVEGELHPGESTEEKISLSERFGLWLSFQPFGQEQYLELARLHLRRLGYKKWNEATQRAALQWALERASRSGRVAQQFARHWSAAGS
jgi:uncharacterized protein